MARLGNCRSCGYMPVARNAIVCPSCGKIDPNPGFFTKWIGRLITLVFIVAFVVIVFTIIAAQAQ